MAAAAEVRAVLALHSQVIVSQTERMEHILAQARTSLLSASSKVGARPEVRLADGFVRMWEARLRTSVRAAAAAEGRAQGESKAKRNGSESAGSGTAAGAKEEEEEEQEDLDQQPREGMLWSGAEKEPRPPLRDMQLALLETRIGVREVIEEEARGGDDGSTHILQSPMPSRMQQFVFLMQQIIHVEDMFFALVLLKALVKEVERMPQADDDNVFNVPAATQDSSSNPNATSTDRDLAATDATVANNLRLTLLKFVECDGVKILTEWVERYPSTPMTVAAFQICERLPIRRHVKKILQSNMGRIIKRAEKHEEPQVAQLAKAVRGQWTRKQRKTQASSSSSSSSAAAAAAVGETAESTHPTSAQQNGTSTDAAALSALLRTMREAVDQMPASARQVGFTVPADVVLKKQVLEKEAASQTQGDEKERESKTKAAAAATTTGRRQTQPPVQLPPKRQRTQEASGSASSRPGGTKPARVDLLGSALARGKRSKPGALPGRGTGAATGSTTATVGGVAGAKAGAATATTRTGASQSRAVLSFGQSLNRKAGGSSGSGGAAGGSDSVAGGDGGKGGTARSGRSAAGAGAKKHVRFADQAGLPLVRWRTISPRANAGKTGEHGFAEIRAMERRLHQRMRHKVGQSFSLEQLREEAAKLSHELDDEDTGAQAREQGRGKSRGPVPEMQIQVAQWSTPRRVRHTELVNDAGYTCERGWNSKEQSHQTARLRNLVRFQNVPGRPRPSDPGMLPPAAMPLPVTIPKATVDVDFEVPNTEATWVDASLTRQQEEQLKAEEQQQALAAETAANAAASVANLMPTTPVPATAAPSSSSSSSSSSGEHAMAAAAAAPVANTGTVAPQAMDPATVMAVVTALQDHDQDVLERLSAPQMVDAFLRDAHGNLDQNRVTHIQSLPSSEVRKMLDEYERGPTPPATLGGGGRGHQGYGSGYGGRAGGGAGYGSGGTGYGSGGPDNRAVCQYDLAGYCRLGNSCRFRHLTPEERAYHQTGGAGQQILR